MTFRELDPAAAHEALRTSQGAVYLDVRSTAEFEQGHPEGALNIPLLEAGPGGLHPNPLFARVACRVLDADALVVVGCRSGQRSRIACELLGELGFASLVNVAGGYSGSVDPLTRTVLVAGWADHGLPTSREPSEGRSWEALRTSALDADD